jgi:hypothetical protein
MVLCVDTRDYYVCKIVIVNTQLKCLSTAYFNKIYIMNFIADRDSIKIYLKQVRCCLERMDVAHE